MTEAAAKIKDQLAALSDQDRLEIMGYLPRTVDRSADVEAEWDDELARRWQEIEDGTAEETPIEEVNARLRVKYSWNE